MSVNSLLHKLHRSLLAAWPFYLLLLLLVGAGLTVVLYWPQIMLQSILWQKSLHGEMTGLLQQVASHPRQVGGTLMGFSLVYGVLHALGPGHGKVVIATFLATHPAKVKTSLQLTLAAAILQGGVAIALVTLMLVVLQLSSRQLHLSSYWLEKGSYLLVIAFGMWLCWRAMGKMTRLLKKPDAPMIRAESYVANSQLAAPWTIKRLIFLDNQHHAQCGCDHQHVPDSDMLDKVVNGKTKAIVVLSMGLRPCSGAITMLLFAKVIGIYGWGVLSALAMAAGTALTVSAMALLVQVSRALAIKLGRRVSPQGWQKVGLVSVSLVGGMTLVVMGIILWLSAQPAMSGGIRPMF